MSDDPLNDLEGTDPGWTREDSDVIRAALTGDGLVVVNAGMLRSAAEAAHETMVAFQDEVERLGMTEDQARFVRRARVDREFTWRAVARTCALEWGGSWGANQLAGMAICRHAAALLGEDYMQDPWN